MPTEAGRNPRRAQTLAAALPALVLALAPIAAHPTQPSSLDRPEVVEPVDLDRWITQLWEPVGSVGGRLDDDELDDVAVVLYRRDAIPGDLGLPVGSRAIAVFSLGADGRYRRTALAEGILPCADCLGTLSRDPRGFPFEIDIDEGRRLQVSWIGNADGLQFVHLTIAWDPERQEYGLIADEVVRLDPLIGWRSRRYRDFQAGRQWMDGEERPLAARFVPMDSVKADDYR